MPAKSTRMADAPLVFRAYTAAVLAWGVLVLPVTGQSADLPGSGPRFDSSAPRGVAAAEPVAPDQLLVSLQMEEESLRENYGSDGIWMQSLGMVAAFLFCLVFHMAALGFILGQCGARWAAPSRIELVGATITPASGQAPVNPASAQLPQVPVAPPFPLDPGPTLVGKSQQQEEANKQKEEAIFGQILEQNLWLQTQLHSCS
jgi:hypothetical protein